MPVTTQLVVLVSRFDVIQATRCALDQTRHTPGLHLRDAAILTGESDGDVVVTEIAENEWPGRRPLGHRWWQAMAGAITDEYTMARRLLEAHVSRSFLAEVSESVASGLAALALIVEGVEIKPLLRDVGEESFLKVIYGMFPASAIDDLADLAADP